MFVALGVQRAMRMCHVIVCCLSGSTIFCPIISQRAQFSKQRYWTHTQIVGFDFRYKFSLKIFSLQKQCSDMLSQLYIGLHVKCRLLLGGFSGTGMWLTHYREILKYQMPWKSVQWQPSSPMRPDRRTDRHDDAKCRFPHFSERP